MKVWGILLLVAGLFSHSAAAEAQANQLSTGQLQAIRALVEKTIAQHQVPGASFALGLGGQVAWSEGFGFSDLENHVKAVPDTAYRTASIGKAMTATRPWNSSSSTSSIWMFPSRPTAPAFLKNNGP